MDTRAYLHTSFGTPQFHTLLRITCFFWLLAKVLSMKAWLADRLYPVVPVFDFIDCNAFVYTAVSRANRIEL